MKDFANENVTINKRNHLEIGGCDCIDLVNKFGTPLYVLDENLIRENCRIYKSAIERNYNGNGMVLYASKAFCTMAMCRIIHQEGLGLDVVSGGELYTAIKSGFPADRIYFHGNNKTLDEIEMAIDCNIRRIVVDNKFELYAINRIASQKGKVVNISFRIKPGIEAHTHSFIQTGQIDSKFGVALENGEAFEIIALASQMENVKVTGIHCHIGSQIFDIAPFKLAAQVMLDFIEEIKIKLGIEIEELNLGGGYGVKYLPEDDAIDYGDFVDEVATVVKSICEAKNIKIPFMLIEPGRSIVAAAGITLYKVGAVKDIKNVRKYVSVDGGMTDNPRYALYKSKYNAILANKPDAIRTEVVTIAGKCCESGDILVEGIMMPEIQVGDIIAIQTTGAYNYSMSSNYNRIPRPAVVLVKDGNARIIVKREDYEDILRNDVIPFDL